VISITEKHFMPAYSPGQPVSNPREIAVTQDCIKPSQTLKPADHPKQRELTEQELATASGGLLFTFKLVAVKTVGWAND
jgi:hypothetical protein